MRLLVTLIAFLFLGSGTNAKYELSYQMLFQTVCMGSNLDANQLDSLVEFVAENLDVQLLEFPKEQIGLTGIGNERGWVLKGKSNHYMVMRGKKADGNRVSNNCTIGIRDEKPEKVSEFIEESFNVTKVVDEVQGSSKVRIYSADLIGFDRELAIGIQSGDGLVMLSLFQF